MRRRILAGTATLLGLAVAAFLAVTPAGASSTIRATPVMNTSHTSQQTFQSAANLGIICTWAYNAHGYPYFQPCDGDWEQGSYNYASVYSQYSGTHSDTNFYWVPYPADPSWGWLEDPNGEAIAWDAAANHFVMYTPENVWWELFQPGFSGWPAGNDGAIWIDWANNGSHVACMMWYQAGGLIGVDSAGGGEATYQCGQAAPDPSGWPQLAWATGVNYG